MTDTMTCAYCNRAKAWPDAFVSRIYAQCWECWADHHMETKHPKRWWQRVKALRHFATRGHSTDGTIPAIEPDRITIIGTDDPKTDLTYFGFELHVDDIVHTYVMPRDTAHTFKTAVIGKMRELGWDD